MDWKRVLYGLLGSIAAMLILQYLGVSDFLSGCGVV